MGELSCTMSVTKCRSHIGYVGYLGHRHCRQGTRFTKVSTNILIILELKHIAGADTGFEVGGGRGSKTHPAHFYLKFDWPANWDICT